ncbi:MAG: CoA-disulfide reductase [Brevinemataceae bacterium]
MQFLIIGGNAAGMSAATRIRKNIPDASITVLEKGNIVSFGACGLPYFVGHEFDQIEDMIARPLEAFQKSNINVLLHHEVLSIDPSKKQVTAVNKENKEVLFSYDKVLISTGAFPIKPPIPGIDLPGVFTLTTMEDGIELRNEIEKSSVQNIVIIGGGFIGLETAEAMLHSKKNVTVIEMENHVSAKVFDPEITDLLHQNLKKHGVHLRLNEKVLSIEGKDCVEKITTDKGSYPADLIITAVGFAPATKWCQNIKLEMLGNGAIVIDDLGKTNIPDIYAAGDCATIKHAVIQQNQYIPLATGANKLGRFLGDVMSDKSTAPFQGSLGSSALRFMDFEAGRTGLSEYQAKAFGFNYGTNFIKDFNHTSYVPGRSEIFIKLIYDKDSRIILGGQICGKKDAVLRVDVLAAAIFKKMTVEELGQLDLIYAPPFARTWEALNIAGNTCK